jgi:hypothetical protein
VPVMSALYPSITRLSRRDAKMRLAG